MPIGAQIYPTQYRSKLHRFTDIAGESQKAAPSEAVSAKDAAAKTACGAWNSHMIKSLDQNGKLFDEARDALMRLLGVAVAAFAFQLWLAVSAAAAAIVLGLWLDASLAMLFGAVALVSIGTLWAAHPLRFLERHLGFVSMLHVIRQTYMTGLMRMPDSPTLQKDIEQLKSSAMSDLARILVTIDKRSG